MTKGKKTTIKSKAAVKKQNQFKTEYKDRVSRVNEYTLGVNTGSSSQGVENSLLLMPDALTKIWTQGTENGQIEGNQVNARFLKMKVKLNFDNLPPYVLSDGSATRLPQSYNLRIYQVLIMENMREYLTGNYSNANSGREQPAIADSATLAQDYKDIANKFLYNSRIQPEFLSFERRLDTGVRILKSWRVLGDTTAKLNQSAGTAPQSATDSGGIISPEKHYTFEWKQPKDKMVLSPVLNGSTTLDGYAVASNWIPAVLVTLDRGIPDDAVATNLLNVSTRSHFTYTEA